MTNGAVDSFDMFLFFLLGWFILTSIISNISNYLLLDYRNVIESNFNRTLYILDELRRREINIIEKPQRQLISTRTFDSQINELRSEITILRQRIFTLENTSNTNTTLFGVSGEDIRIPQTQTPLRVSNWS